MTVSETVKKLRNRQVLNYFDKQSKTFTRINLNKKDSKVCWERWTSKDRINWVNQNLYLSLKDVLKIRQKMIDDRINPNPKTNQLAIVII